ncbi:MAG: PP2C family protein-serine/threonine phosphatase [Ignavibacteriales bacterium]|nr:PP2C family protein-serine/threonine phosphatase [Ignavibacteriales bacterium]
MNLTNNTALRNLSALVDFSNNINSNLNLDFALNNLLLTCFGKLHTTKGIIALYENEILNIKLLKGFSPKDAERIIEIIETNDEENFSYLLTEENIKIYEKLISSDKTIGFIFLGGKLSGQLYENEDKMFLSTITQIGSAAIKNIQNFEKLDELNKQLDSKINQLNSLFDLGKEFSSILEIDRVSKLLIFAISAQMLVSKFAIVLIQEDNFKILETKYNPKQLNDLLSGCNCKSINTSILTNNSDELEELNKIGIDVIVPMVIKNVTKGFIFLGKRLSKKNYSQSDLEYLSSVASLAIISIENSMLFQQALEKQKIEKDLEIARNIQRNLLPRTLPKSDKFEIEAINKTAKMVGGDFYDVVQLTDKKLLIAIADVSGKGIQASLLMANLQAFLKAIYKQNYKLEEASNFLNDVVSENTTNGSFITFFWGILDTESNEFSYVNMGHNPPLLVDDQGIRKLNKGGMILGVMKTIIPYEMETVKLKTDDVILLFTDGITEAMDYENNEFTDERLEDLVLKSFKHNSKMILHNIMEDINKHTVNTEQSDDITCLVLKIK